jgi:hypothetical protein
VTDLTKAIERKLLTFSERGRTVIVRITGEGIYMKQAGQRWSSAVLCPWAAAHSVAHKLSAQHLRDERRARRRTR